MKKNLHWNHKSEILKPEIPMKLSKEKYVSIAEKVVLHLNGNTNERFTKVNETVVLKANIEAGKQKFDLTTTKIRNLLSLLNVIYQDIMNRDSRKKTESDDWNQLETEIVGKIQYFKMRCAYEAGRDKAVADLVEKSNLMNYIDNIKDSRDNFITFFHYVEALVAYHRYYGGREN